jgi:hypothetical protein
MKRIKFLAILGLLFLLSTCKKDLSHPKSKNSIAVIGNYVSEGYDNKDQGYD